MPCGCHGHWAWREAQKGVRPIEVGSGWEMLAVRSLISLHIIASPSFMVIHGDSW